MQSELRHERERLVLRGALKGTDAAGFHSYFIHGCLVRLNGMAAGILSLCDGKRTRLDIVEHLSGGLDATYPRLVGEFLDVALRSGWLVLQKPLRLSSDSYGTLDSHASLAGSSGSAYT